MEIKASILKTARNHRIVTAVSAGIIVLGAGWFLWPRTPENPEFVQVVFGDIVQEVSVTGAVKASEELSLGFERAGTVARVYVKVGQSVVPGQPLAELSNGDLAADRAAAEGNLKAEEARLAEIRRGTRPEEIRVQESKVASSEVQLFDTRRAFSDKITDGYTRVDDAIHNSIDQFFTNPRTTNPKLIFNATETELKTLIESERLKIESRISAWKPIAAEVFSGGGDVRQAATYSRDTLQTVKNFLEHVATAVNSLTTSSFSQATIDSYRASVSAARTSVSTAIANLTAAEDSYRSAEASFALAQRELELVLAGATSEEIAVQEARVLQAKAELLSRGAQLSKTVLLSPIYGVVTRQDAHVGESVSAQTDLVGLISRAAFEIEANVPEADIAKVAVGQKALVTLDAYGFDEQFGARVVAVDPAATLIDGVPTYTITLQFDTKDSRVRSGMTANIDIETAKKDQVLAVPQRAIITKDRERFVRILLGNEVREVPVSVGIRGSDGLTEIVAGIEEGDRIIISRPE